MALIQTHFFSEALTECNSMNVIIPIEKFKRDKYPVLWLLPPVGRDHTAWQRNTPVEQLADRYGIMVVMPDMKLSYGLNMVHGFDYFKMLTEELPVLVADYYPADTEFQIIAGAREGAYEAMMAVLRFPGRYRAAAAFSAGSLTDETWKDKEQNQAEHAFGTGDMAALKGGEYDLGYWLENFEDENLHIYLEYSCKDPYAISAQILEKNLKKRTDKQLFAKVHLEPLTWEGWIAGVEYMVKKEINL